MSLWERERRTVAAALYADVVGRWPRGNLHYPDVVGEYACVLSELDRGSEALAQYQVALLAELEQGGANESAAVALARLHVGAQAMRVGDPTLARESVAPSLGKNSTFEAALRCVQAQAEWALGARSEARTSAHAALSAAASEGLAANLRDTLQAILES